MNPATQHQHFLRALDLLGGSRSAARALGISERTIDRLKSGTSPLHAGLLRDLSAALTAHAAACRQLERDLSPAFAANLTAPQLARPIRPATPGAR